MKDWTVFVFYIICREPSWRLQFKSSEVNRNQRKHWQDTSVCSVTNTVTKLQSGLISQESWKERTQTEQMEYCAVSKYYNMFPVESDILTRRWSHLRLGLTQTVISSDSLVFVHRLFTVVQLGDVVTLLLKHRKHNNAPLTDQRL